MWQRFTENARLTIYRSQEAAASYMTNSVNTEHLLLGLLFEQKFDYVSTEHQLNVYFRSDNFVQNRAVIALQNLNVNIRDLKNRIESEASAIHSQEIIDESFCLTPRVKRVIDLAYDESRNLGKNYVGTEHLLLGLIREYDGRSAQILREMGVAIDATRNVVFKTQGS
jgi:ATP-dependent Clp protease ATP-binding subunit ClpC